MLAGGHGDASDCEGGAERRHQVDPAHALDRLEAAICDSCATESAWQAKVAASVHSAVDLVMGDLSLAKALIFDGEPETDHTSRYKRITARLLPLLRGAIPDDPGAVGRRVSGTDEALIAGLVHVVASHVRVERLDRLPDLRSALVLFALLPYAGFEEARRWADRTCVDGPRP